MISKYSPKTKNNGLTVVNAAAAIAVSVFNDGVNTLGHMLENLGLSVGAFTDQFLQYKDTMCILTSQRMASSSSSRSSYGNSSLLNEGGSVSQVPQASVEFAGYGSVVWPDSLSERLVDGAGLQ